MMPAQKEVLMKHALAPAVDDGTVTREMSDVPNGRTTRNQRPTTTNGSRLPLLVPGCSSVVIRPLCDSALVLELDRYDIYRVSLEFQQLVTTITARVRGELRSQLDRAALSITLNCAEAMVPHYLLEETG